MLSIKTKKLLLITAFSLTFLVTRIPFLGPDEINPDAVNWHFRSEQFIVGLKSADFLKTYQHYHPGVTLMWIMGSSIELARQINPSYRIYNQENFLVQHSIAKYSLMAVQLILSITILLALKDIIGFKKSFLTAFIFSLEPFFLGNSRLLHMDVLLTLFMFLSLIYAYRYRINQSIVNIVLSGVFAGLAFLTKSVGVISIGFVCLFLILSGVKKLGNWKASIICLVTFIITVFLLFPALWVKPQFVLSDIYNESLRIGTRRGHEQVVLGETTDMVGSTFYPLVLALKTSPLIWFGVVLTVIHLIVHQRKYQTVDKKFLLIAGIFYLLYFVGMSLASKKLDRYMIPIFPLLGLISGVTIMETVEQIKGRSYKIVFLVVSIIIAGFGIMYPLVKLYPYYFTYNNPFFGSAEKTNKIVGQKPFGVGIPELKNRLNDKYGDNVPLGFIDIKPMSMIYPNSKLFDIREAGTKRYDLIVLGPNEALPENVTESEFSFKKDYSMYINGLEYWRVYKKVL